MRQCKPKTNDALKGHVHLVEKLKQNRTKRVSSLNACKKRKLNAKIRALSYHERLVNLLRSNNGTRINVVLDTMLKRGYSIQRCVHLLQEAAEVRKKRIVNYTEKEKDMALLVMTLGGPRLVQMFYKEGLLPQCPYTHAEKKRLPLTLNAPMRSPEEMVATMRPILQKAWGGATGEGGGLPAAQWSFILTKSRSGPT